MKNSSEMLGASRIYVNRIMWVNVPYMASRPFFDVQLYRIPDCLNHMSCYRNTYGALRKYYGGGSNARWMDSNFRKVYDSAGTFLQVHQGQRFHLLYQKAGRFFGDGPSRKRNDLFMTRTMSRRHKTVALYIAALAIFAIGGSYAAVPLYRLYCQASGLGGTVKIQDVGEKIETMEKKKDRKLTIRFNADTSSTMQWNFKPQQSQIKIVPGETALAFYTAKNPTDQPVTGVSTYNVIPFEAGQYFNKIQCFCFEEQRLNANEEVDMPVFFYIDPEFTEDPAMYKIDTITLSYTFFEAREGLQLPTPGY